MVSGNLGGVIHPPILKSFIRKWFIHSSTCYSSTHPHAAVQILTNGFVRERRQWRHNSRLSVQSKNLAQCIRPYVAKFWMGQCFLWVIRTKGGQKLYTIVGPNIAVLLLCVGYDIIVLLILYYFSKLYLQQLYCCILHLSRILQCAKVQLKNCGKYADGRRLRQFWHSSTNMLAAHSFGTWNWI